MPCYYPIMATQPPNGGQVTLYSREQAHLYNKAPGKHFRVPCGQCNGCRRRRSLEWASRCMHEAQLHKYNSYITLTYNDENLPPYRSLRHEDYVLFMKKLRHLVTKTHNELLQCIATNQSQKPKLSIEYRVAVRFYLGGEYGELYGRPHYHAILFGVDFNDKIYNRTTKAGEKIYTSETLQKLWKNGYSSVGGVTFATAAYISRYIMKKRTGDNNKTHYEILDPDTGEISIKRKEYNCMSRGKGIGKEWWDKYKGDVITGDYVITRNGRKLKPPRFYDKLLKRHDKAIYEQTKTAREIEAAAKASDNTFERLATKAIVAESQARHQTRNFEQGAIQHGKTTNTRRP